MTARDTTPGSGSQRICPKCGHANSNISLFCAECGAVLNGSQDADHSTGGGTASIAQPAFDSSAGVTMSASNDTQSTQPIRTTTAEQEWAAMMAESGDDANATALLPRMDPPVSSVTAPEPATSAPAASTEAPSPWAMPAATATGGAMASPAGVSFGVAEEHRQSMRGFWFGVIGFLLILIVLGLYGWSILPDGGFRDTVQGWF
ncbi:MAG: zinc-ribbon domain-containing protein [Thermomicrobiales bacterium]